MSADRSRVALVDMITREPDSGINGPREEASCPEMMRSLRRRLCQLDDRRQEEGDSLFARSPSEWSNRFKEKRHDERSEQNDAARSQKPRSLENPIFHSQSVHRKQSHQHLSRPANEENARRKRATNQPISASNDTKPPPSPSHQPIAEQRRAGRLATSQISKQTRTMNASPRATGVWLAGAALLWCVAGAALGQSHQSVQRFEAQPEPATQVQSGHEARLRCLVRDRQGECLWLRNGRAIASSGRKYKFERQPEDGDCSLSIRNASVHQDDGFWQCQVTSANSDQFVDQDTTLQSREVHLIVLVPPEQPQIKNTAQSTSSLVGPAQPNNNSQNPTTSQRLTQSRLRLSDVRRALNGKNLTCVGIHQTGNQLTSAELDVQYLPTVSVVQREYSIVEGSPLSISCQVDANPPPNLINWRLVNEAPTASARSGGNQPQAASAGSSAPAASSPSPAGPVSLPTRPGPVLEFERISRDLNQNVFECLAQNSYGISLPADVKLNVLYAPYLLNTSNSESVPVGSDAQLACLFDGNPEPEIKWLYTDPLSRSASGLQLAEAAPSSAHGPQASAQPLSGQAPSTNPKSQQFLNIKNVSYRNEGDYHCEARNQINGVYYGVRSSNIILDVFGEPQFLAKSPVNARAIRGSKSDFGLAFCSDPAPSKVFWQFGSIRLDVRLNNQTSATLAPGESGSAGSPSAGSTARNSLVGLLFNPFGGGSSSAHPAPPSGAGAQKQPAASNQHQQQQLAIQQRFLVHPLQSLQRRESAFSRTPTCFEAQLSLLDPELSDQREYMLTVQNERGQQSATVRLHVSSPLSPVLIISSALITICGLFLLSLLLLFLIRARQLASAELSLGDHPSGNGNAAPGHANSEHNQLNGKSKELINGMEPASVEHLAINASHGIMDGYSNGLLQTAGAQQHTNGVVNGLGAGHANQASNLLAGRGLHHQSAEASCSLESASLSQLGHVIQSSPSLDHHNKSHNLANLNTHRHASMGSSDSSGAGGDQRKLLNSEPQPFSACSPVQRGAESPLGSVSCSLSSRRSSSGSTLNQMMQQHRQASNKHATNVDFNLHSSTLTSANSSSSSSASSTRFFAQQKAKDTAQETNKLERDETLDEEQLSIGATSVLEAPSHQHMEPHAPSSFDPSGQTTSAHMNLQAQFDDGQRGYTGATYRAAESVTRGLSSLSQFSQHHAEDKNAIIYANVTNSCSAHEAALANLSSPLNQLSNGELTNEEKHQHQQSISRNASLLGHRSKVGATIAMMNSLAAAASASSASPVVGAPAPPTQSAPPASKGVLNGAIRQQLAAAHSQAGPLAARKQGPPKPPKPNLQQASRFYQQAAAAAQRINNANQNNHDQHGAATPSRDELAVEYSQLAFPERAEL